MAASATSLSTFSSLSLHHSSRRFSLPTTSLSLTSSTTTPLYYSPLSLSTSTKLHCNPPETIFYESEDPDYQIPPFTPAEIPDDFASIAVPAVNETLEEIIAGYEELYGPAYSGVSVLGNDVNVMDSKRSMKVDAYGKLKKEPIRDGFDERVVQVRRVTKVVKGGKQLHFRAVVVVGDKRGKVGVGVGKAKEVISAVQKGAVDARRNVISVPLTKDMTFPHRANGKYGAAEVMLRPACPGTGVLAGGAVKIVLELAGLENALGKQLGSDNALNNARATLVAVMKMTSFSEVSERRGIPIEEMWK